MAAMVAAIIAFSFALFLREGDVWAFAVICLASGATLGADLTLLPAIFAQRMEKIAPNATEGFSLWSFAQKFTLAFAARRSCRFSKRRASSRDKRILLTRCGPSACYTRSSRVS